MVEKIKLKELKKEFGFLKEKVLGVLLFGSGVDRSCSSRSDIDICIVAPKKKISTILRSVRERVDVYGKKYDVYVFEELPLYMKVEVMGKHKVLIAGDVLDLYEYFYYYRKLWDEQKHRQEISKEEILKMV